MSSRETEPTLKTLLQGTLSRHVKSLADDRNYEQAQEVCKSFLVQNPLRDAARILPRFEAICNLFLLARHSKNEMSLDWTTGRLKSDIDQVVSKFQDAPETRELTLQMIHLAEVLGNALMWPSVKTLSRMILRTIFDDKPDSVRMRIRALNNLGSALLAENRVEDAAHVWKCAIRDYDPKAAGYSPAPLSTLHNNMGELSRLRCEFVQALICHERALELRLEVFSEDNLLVRQSRFNLAQVLADCHQHQQSAEQVFEYLTLIPDELQSSVAYLRGAVLEARVLIHRGEYLAAETRINQLVRSLSSKKETPGRLIIELHLLRLELAILMQKENVISSELRKFPELLAKHNLKDSIYAGQFLSLAGRVPRDIELEPPYDQRETQLQQASSVLRQRAARNHPWIAGTVFELADLYQRTQRGQRAAQTANSGVSLCEEAFGEDSLPTAAGLLRMARLVFDQNQPKVAKQYLKRVFVIFRSSPEIPRLTLLDAYELLSRIYQKLGKNRLSSYYATAASRHVAQNCDLPPNIEMPYVNRALQQTQSVGHYHFTATAYQRLIELLTAEYFADHPAVAEATEQLGRTYFEMQQYEDAADNLLKVVSVRCAELGEDSPLSTDLRQLTADACRRAGRDDEAAELDGQIQQISDQASHVLSDLF